MQGDERIDEARARAVWRRAAELQAEAAHRLEERSSGFLVGKEEADSSDSGFRRSDVEAAAVEAGISPEFVRLALAESERSEHVAELSGWQENAATRLLGSSMRSVEVSRAIAAPASEVWEAMQRVFPAHPYLLTLRDAVGDPLDGGLLIFYVASVYTSSTYTQFTYALATVGVKQLRVALRPSATDAESSEVGVSGDLRSGVRTNWWFGAGLTGTLAGGGAAAGAALGVATLGGVLIALPAVAGAALLGAGTAAGYRAVYRWGLRRTSAALEQLLEVVDVNARTRGAFAPPRPLPGADAAGVLSPPSG